MSGMRAFKGRRVLAITVGLLSGAAAHAAVLSWANAAGGPASTASNWSPVQVPTATDDLTFNLGANYAVTFNSTTSASRTQTFRQGTVTLTMTSPHTTSNGVAIGDLTGDVSTVTLATGTWSSGPAGFVNVGDAAGSTGTFNINDDDAAFNVTGTSDLFVGNNGLGTMNITGGGRVICNDLMHVGQGSAATGNLTVSGFVPSLPFPISQLQVNGTGESRWGNGGDATVNVSNGALAHFAGDLVVGNLSTSIANVTVQGAGFVLGATLDVDGDLLLGRNTSASLVAGTGTLNVNSPGRVLVGGSLFVAGDPDGGTGALNLNSGGLVDATSVAIGSGGTLSHTGGTLRINGGAFTGHADPLVVTGTGSPTLVLSSNLSKTIAPAGAVGLIVGDDTGAGTFTGTLQIDSGADLILSGSSKDINIGDDAGTTGTVTVDGASSRLVADQPGDDLRVGNNGTGTLHIINGGQVLARNVLVPGVSGGVGTILLDDTGASLTTVNLTVGHASGTGSGNIVDDATTTITATDPANSVVIRNTGVVAITGHLNAAGTVLLAGGDLNVHGTVTAGALVDVQSGSSLRSGASVSGTPVVDGPVRVRSGGRLEASANDLTIGDATDPNGFLADDGSLVNVIGRTLTINDSNRAVADDVTITGGEIIARNGLEIFTPGTNGTLTGTGTITTSELFMESGGGVITATTAAGITINGKFRNNSGMIDGTKYTFNQNPAIADSGWTGAGTIDAQVVFNSGTSVNALANMTMGDGSTLGVTFNAGSEMHADTRTITLLDSNGVGLPSVTDFNGGHIVCAQPLTVNNGRRLSGRGGSIDAPSVTVHGRLSPGELVGEVAGETGELTINGNLTLGVNSATDIEIAGLLGPIQYDRVVVNGVATLDGDLNISIIDGFDPPFGSVWTIMDYDSKVGDFANITVTGPSCVFVAVSDRAIVVSRGLPGDLDDDGDVDINDLALLLSNFGCRGGVEFPCPIDLDLNGDTDITDLAILLSNFGQACN